MKGTIANFRGSHKTKYGNQMIITVSSIADKEKAKALIGKEVVWKSPAGKEIKGKVTKEHGNSGALRVYFEKGMPGQSLAGDVEIKA